MNHARLHTFTALSLAPRSCATVAVSNVPFLPNRLSLSVQTGPSIPFNSFNTVLQSNVLHDMSVGGAISFEMSVALVIVLPHLDSKCMNHVSYHVRTVCFPVVRLMLPLQIMKMYNNKCCCVGNPVLRFTSASSNIGVTVGGLRTFRHRGFLFLGSCGVW